MTQVIPTKFLHERDAYGRRLRTPCSGRMELRLPEGGGPVECVCSICNRGWAFEFWLGDSRQEKAE